MRIAYLSCDFGVPVFGTNGSSVHLRELVRALRRLGHDVRVFSPAVEEGAPFDGVCPVPLAPSAADAVARLKSAAGLPEHLHREWRRLLYAETAGRALRPLLEAYRPDAIYERYALFSYAGMELARDLGLPHVLEVNAPLVEEALAHRELVLRATAEELERSVLRGAGAVVVVSGALEAHARALGVAPERIAVLPNAVDPQRFRPDVSGAEVRARYGLEGRVVVGFAGSMKPWHDLETLVAAVERLARDDPRVRLLAVGDGPGRDVLRRAGPLVTCTGVIAHDAMPAHLAAMDVVAVPLAPDAGAYFSPIKLFEAMAMARPIVAARAGQIAELTTDGETALLYEAGDAAGLAATIRTMIARPDGGAALGAAARARVLERHTWEGNARRVAALIASLRGEEER